MRRRGQGSIVRRPNGLWQASIQVRGKRLTAYGKTKAEAAAKLKELRQQAEAAEARANGNPRDPEKTVIDLIKDWLTTGNLKPRTKADYELMTRVYIEPHIGDIPISELTPTDIQGLYSKLESPSVTDKIHRILHRCFALGVLWGALESNPCDRVVRPRYQSNRKTLWTVEQVRSFLEGTRGHWLYPLWVLAVTTGCRLGELLAIRWYDVDLKAGTITISRTLTWVDGGPIFDVPKTRAGIRTLQLLPEVVEVLSSLRGNLEDVASDSLIFPGPRRGRPIYPSVVQHALRRECRRLGLPEFTPHGLRHLHASLLLSNGVPVPLVSRQLGHANPGVTMTIYAHAIGPGSQVTQALNGVLKGDPNKGRGEV